MTKYKYRIVQRWDFMYLVQVKIKKFPISLLSSWITLSATYPTISEARSFISWCKDADARGKEVYTCGKSINKYKVIETYE